MVADSHPARRPVLPAVGASIFRGVTASSRSLGVVLLTLLLSAGTLVGWAGLPGQASPAFAAAPASGVVTVRVSPTRPPALVPGQDLALTVSITNGSEQALTPGTVKVYLAERALSSQSAVSEWLASSNTGGSGDLLQSVATRADIPPGTTTAVPVTVPAASVGLGTGNAWGARGLAATFDAGAGVVAEGRGTFVWAAGAAPAPVHLALAMPITTPAGSTGLLPASALETFTGPTGLLTRQLDGVINRPVAIAIDPMIIASIRVLGSDAPPSALAWLDRLAAATNDIFPLSYADADIALQAQAGVTSLLGPIAFDQAIDPARFGGQAPAPSPTIGTEQTSPPVAPSPTPGPATPPTIGELLSWNYTATDIAWPAEGTVTATDLPVFAASGLATTILSGSQVMRPESDPTDSAVVTVAGATAVAVDDNVSRAIRRAAMAASQDEWESAMAEAASRLAIVAAETPSVSASVLATFDRGWPPSSERLAQTIDALSGIQWSSPVTLGRVTGTRPAAEATLQPKPEPPARLGLGRALLQREAEITGFSSALANPVALTAAHRLTLLALYATRWIPELAAWEGAVANNLDASAKVLRSVTVTTKGPINVVGSKVDIPLTLRNSLDQAVTVRVQVVPSNGRLVVGGDVDATIEADSARTVKVPVSAAVGNGDVTLRVSMFTPTGAAVDQATLIAVNVRADWEGLGAALFAILVVLFFGFGVWRNIARRRRELAQEKAQPVDTPVSPGASAVPVPQKESDVPRG